MSYTKQEDNTDSLGSKSTGNEDIKDDDEDPQEDTLKSVALFFLENCTAHGLPRVAVERSVFRKVVWAIIFAGALGYFCFTLQSIISTFLKYEVNVKTVLRSRDRVVFPAVTVCNLNRLRKADLKGTHYESILHLADTYRNKIDPSFTSDSVDARLLDDPPDNDTELSVDIPVDDTDESGDDIDDSGDDSEPAIEPFAVDDSELYKVDDAYDFHGFLSSAKTQDYSDLQDILRPNQTEYDKWGHKLKDLIVQCSFDRSDCNMSVDFIQTYSAAYGNCYTFNSALGGQKMKSTNRYGSIYGLRLTLDVELFEYLGMFTQEVGVRVSVHHPKIFPFPESNGYSAPVGKSTSLGISTTLVRRQPYPYTSHCASANGQVLFYNGSYTLENCQLSCYRKELLRRCNCVDTVLNKWDEPRCGYVNKTQVVCRQKVKYDYSIQKLSCLHNCTEPCWDMTYGADASYVEWPNERYGYFLVDKLRSTTGYKNLTAYNIKTSMARVHVYMDTFQLLEIIESPAYTWDNLLADCGGTLGLFIGLSVCTALEFMELILDCIIVLTRKCCGRNRKGTKSRSIQVKPASDEKPV